MLTIGAAGTEDDIVASIGNLTEEHHEEGSRHDPVSIASIEELPASRDGSPTLARKHGKVCHGSEAADVCGKVVIPAHKLSNGQYSSIMLASCRGGIPAQAVRVYQIHKMCLYILPLLATAVCLGKEDDRRDSKNDESYRQGTHAGGAHLVTENFRILDSHWSSSRTSAHKRFPAYIDYEPAFARTVCISCVIFP
jgi:hypothetical protein